MIYSPSLAKTVNYYYKSAKLLLNMHFVIYTVFLFALEMLSANKKILKQRLKFDIKTQIAIPRNMYI